MFTGRRKVNGHFRGWKLIHAFRREKLRLPYFTHFEKKKLYMSSSQAWDTHTCALCDIPDGASEDSYLHYLEAKREAVVKNRIKFCPSQQMMPSWSHDGLSIIWNIFLNEKQQRPSSRRCWSCESWCFLPVAKHFKSCYDAVYLKQKQQFAVFCLIVSDLKMVHSWMESTSSGFTISVFI